MIHFACPECQKVYKVADEFAGRETPCRQCGQTLRVPERAASPVVETAATFDKVAGAHSAVGHPGDTLFVNARRRKRIGIVLAVGVAFGALLATGAAFIIIAGRGGVDKAKIAVVGCPGLHLGGSRRDNVPALAVGTHLTILVEEGHELQVQIPDGTKGSLPRWAVCSVQELERRQAENQVPEFVGVIVNDNGKHFLRGQFQIRNGSPAFVKGQAFWLGPSMVGEKFTLGGEEVSGDPQVLFFADAQGRCVRLSVWGNANPVALVGHQPKTKPQDDGKWIDRKKLDEEEAHPKPRPLEPTTKPDDGEPKAKPPEEKTPPAPIKPKVNLLKKGPDDWYVGDSVTVHLEKQPLQARLEYRLVPEKDWRRLNEDKLEMPNLRSEPFALQIQFRAVFEGQESEVITGSWIVYRSPQCLVDPDLKIRTHAAQLLLAGDYNAKGSYLSKWASTPQAAKAIPMFLPALRDKDGFIRLAVIASLESIANHSPTPETLKLVGDHLSTVARDHKDAFTRDLAARALKSLKLAPQP